MPFNRESKDIWAFFIFCSILILVAYFLYGAFYNPRWDVIDFFRIGTYMKSGMLPYRDFFYEFPPLQLLYIYIPMLFTNSIETYSFIISVMSGICFVITTFFVVKICEVKNLDAKKAILLITVIVISFAFCMSAKMDALIAVVIAMSIYFYVKDKPVVAVSISVIGALIKMTPIILTVVLLLLIIFDKERIDRTKVLVKSIVASVIILIASIIPFLLQNTTIQQIFSFVFVHSGRGMHCESTVAVIAQVLDKLGLIEITSDVYMGAKEIHCTLCDILIPICVPLILIIFGLMIGYFIYVGIKERIPKDANSKFKLLLLGYTILMLVFLLFNKTFSTQYLIWLLPPIIILMLMPGRIRFIYYFGAWLAIYLLSLNALCENSEFPFLFTIRLILFIYLFVSYIMEFYSLVKADKSSTNMPAP